MEADEVVGRVREKILHSLEGLAMRGLRDVEVGPASRQIPQLPEAKAAPQSLKDALAAEAAELAGGRWMLFGWRKADVGSPPCWHRDPTCGVVIPPNVPAYRLNHRHLPDGADARSIWEINRWAEAVRLAMHSHVNGGDAAAETAQQWLEDWMERNPLGRGINWTSPLEAGLRLINFCWFDALVGDRLQATQHKLRNAVLPAHVWWVKRYLSAGSSANNHRLGELTGLLMAVRRWPELGKLGLGAEELWEQISDCVMTQFAADGGNREQALHYHLFAFEMGLHASLAMGISDGPVIERLQRAGEFFVRMAHPVEPWDFGDGDDAQIVPLPMRRESAAAEWHAWLAGSEEPNAEALNYWIGRLQLPLSNTSSTGWWQAKESGLAVIERDGWGLRFDASPLGFGKLAAHGHCDALHLSIWDGEHALIIDPGTGGYYAAQELRAQLASWDAHNGPQPASGLKEPVRIGKFLWAHHHSVPRMEASFEQLRATLESDAFLLCRAVEMKEGTIVITDRISGGQSVRVRWTLAPECVIELAEGEAAERAFDLTRNEARWSIRFSQENEQPPRIERHLVTVSRHFGSREDAWAFEVSSGTGVLKMTITRR